MTVTVTVTERNHTDELEGSQIPILAVARLLCGYVASVKREGRTGFLVCDGRCNWGVCLDLKGWRLRSDKSSAADGGKATSTTLQRDWSLIEKDCRSLVHDGFWSGETWMVMRGGNEKWGGEWLS